MAQSPHYRGITRPTLVVGRLLFGACALGSLAAVAAAAGPAGAVTAKSTKTVTVSVASNSKLGKILVSGKTLYTLSTGNGACNTACRAFWPELVLPKGATKASAGSGVSASKLGTVSRSGGVLQVTYGGKALYTFVGDSGSGSVKGNGVKDSWGKWSVVVTAKSGSKSGKSSKPASGGYGY